MNKKNSVLVLLISVFLLVAGATSVAAIDLDEFRVGLETAEGCPANAKGSVNVREGAVVDQGVTPIAVTSHNQNLSVLVEIETDGTNWYLVRLETDGEVQFGYIRMDLVEKLSGCEVPLGDKLFPATAESLVGEDVAGLPIRVTVEELNSPVGDKYAAIRWWTGSTWWKQLVNPEDCLVVWSHLEKATAPYPPMQLNFAITTDGSVSWQMEALLPEYVPGVTKLAPGQGDQWLQNCTDKTVDHRPFATQVGPGMTEHQFEGGEFQLYNNVTDNYTYMPYTEDLFVDECTRFGGYFQRRYEWVTSAELCRQQPPAFVIAKASESVLPHLCIETSCARLNDVTLEVFNGSDWVAVLEIDGTLYEQPEEEHSLAIDSGENALRDVIIYSLPFGTMVVDNRSNWTEFHLIRWAH